MKNNSPQNFICEFAAETVDFIYGEMSDGRQNAFQIHLNRCDECAAEVSEFSGIKFSIQDWKATEFDRIATPKFEIPYETKIQIAAGEPISFFDSIKNYLRFSPILTSAAAFTILAFLIGSAVFVLQNNREQTIVENIPATDFSPTPKAVRNPPETETSANTEKEKSGKDENETNSPVIEKKVDGRFDDSVSVKTKETVPVERKSSAVKSSEKKSAPPANSAKDIRVQKAVRATKKPRLNDLPDDEDDDSLRLSDMFAELDTKE